MTCHLPLRIRRPGHAPRPGATAKDRIAWRICAFAAGATVGCACDMRGHGHCEAVSKVAETVFTWARDDIERGKDSDGREG